MGVGGHEPTTDPGATHRRRRSSRLFVVVAVLFGFTAVSTKEEAASQVGFDPVTYVDGIWDDVRTAITDNAVPLADVLNRIMPDARGQGRPRRTSPPSRRSWGSSPRARRTSTGSRPPAP